MYVVYVLYSEHSDKLYIGFTSNMEERFISHNKLAKKGFTVKYCPWKVIYTENFVLKQDARKREKALKSSRRKAFIREKIISQIQNPTLSDDRLAR